MTDFRDLTACMMRIKNESRWICKSLERTWQVASRVVIFDDGSTDGTFNEAIRSLGDGAWNWNDTEDSIAIYTDAANESTLYYVQSPFANDDVRPLERANEIRDRGMLWSYMKANVPFEHVLCLDGDEWLSLEAIRTWPKIAAAMDAGADFIQLPFVYLWEGDDRQRIDAIYGPEVDGYGQCLSCHAGMNRDALLYGSGKSSPFSCASPRHKRLRFPRAFSIQRLTTEELYNTRVEWNGTRAGLHCGSIPQSGFQPGGCAPITAFAEAPVVHAGYIDDTLRRQKLDFYRRLDPPGTESNRFEGNYSHIVGEPNQHAPGPVRLAPWEDQ